MDLLKALFLVVTASLSAFVFNYFHWKLQEKSKSIFSTASALKEYLELLEQKSILYWANDYKAGCSILLLQEKRILEIEITSSLKLVRTLTRQLNSIVIGRVYKSEIVKLSNFSSNIYDLVTGDEFEEETIPSNFRKCSKISIQTNEIKAIVLKVMNGNR
jgi:hypothetical protein